MCSIGEDDFGDEGGLHAMLKDEHVLGLSTNLESCTKCGTKGNLIKLSARDAECETCFLVYARHKFRAALGSSKILPKGADVLLLFDGSAESLVLLDMMNYAQTQNTYKRLHVNTKLLFIDESSINPTINIQEAQNLLAKYKFESFIVSIAEKKSLCRLEEFDSYIASNWNTNSFAASVNSIKTLTSRQDFIKVWRSSVIEATAHQLKCDFVFSPDISTNLATELLNNILLGKGGSAAMDVSLLDDRLPGLKVIRPLRNLNSNEVNFYLQVNNMKAIKSLLYGEAFGINSSIQNLTKRFVEDLQTNFSSTVSTVFRTGDKIAPNTSNDRSSAEDNLKCTFCFSPLDCTASKTLVAIEFSRLASALSGNLENCKEQLVANQKSLESDIPGKLCHACSQIQKDCENVNLLQ